MARAPTPIYLRLRNTVFRFAERRLYYRTAILRYASFPSSEHADTTIYDKDGMIVNFNTPLDAAARFISYALISWRDAAAPLPLAASSGHFVV